MFNKKFLKILFLMVLYIFYIYPLYAEDDQLINGNIAIFVIPHNNTQMQNLSEICLRDIKAVFNRLGRFTPVDNDKINSALSSAKEVKQDALFQKTAEILKVEMYIVLSVDMEAGTIYGNLKIFPISKDLEHLKKNIIVSSKILMNIPLKLGRETAFLHKNMMLNVKVLKKYNTMYLINAGQWHGLNAGGYKSLNGSIEIIKTNRYNSLATLSESLKDKNSFIIDISPDIKDLVIDIEKNIDYNTEYKYGSKNTLLKDDDPEKKLITGVCIVNMGANACLPGYGSYLSTSYLGFQYKNPSISGIILSTGLTINHLLLTEFMTGFKTNFFPWVKDKDKTSEIKNLQIFLWSTIPLTFSASFMDQLAHQYSTTKHLPPFFMDKNSAATAFSLFIPGGGLFYKGYRIAGWGYYFSEMILAGYGIYNKKNSKKSLYVFSALGAVKFIELIHAYFITPSYSFYKFEKEGDINRSSFSFGTKQLQSGEVVYGFYSTMNF